MFGVKNSIVFFDLAAKVGESIEHKCVRNVYEVSSDVLVFLPVLFELCKTPRYFQLPVELRGVFACKHNRFIHHITEMLSVLNFNDRVVDSLYQLYDVIEFSRAFQCINLFEHNESDWQLVNCPYKLLNPLRLLQVDSEQLDVVLLELRSCGVD